MAKSCLFILVHIALFNPHFTSTVCIRKCRALFRPGRGLSVVYAGVCLAMMLMYQSVFDEWYVSMMTHGSNARGDLYALLYFSLIVVALLTWTFPLFFSSREMNLSVKLKASGVYFLWSCVWIIFGYVAALIGGFIGILLGYSLWLSKKKLPNGSKVPAYNEEIRKHGRIIFYLGIIMFAVLSILRLTGLCCEK